MQSHVEQAKTLFMSGYNCAQSVFAAYAEDLGLDEAAALRLASSFGGGMGRLRQVCGAVSGALMVLGALKGYDTTGDIHVVGRHYTAVQTYAAAFERKYQTILCREILHLKEGEKTDPIPAPRTPDYYTTRPCLHCVEDAAAILDEMLQSGD